MGRSRGGELALLLAATFPQIRATVAHVPSHVVWPGVAQQSNDELPPSWTFRGERLETFVRRRLPDVAPRASANEPIRSTPRFLAVLREAEDAERAVIPVERIRCPVLLISGRDDGMWPSALMADRVVERLTTRGHPYPVTHLSYDRVGHSVGAPPSLPTTVTDVFHPVARVVYTLGGNPPDIARANAESWQQVRAFFQEHL
jgi:pimeloyl-ACP methyl ester carboxylesterase